MADTIPHRMQVSCRGELILEVIGTYPYLQMIWSRWANLRYSRHKDVGCVAFYRSDIERLWK